MPSKTKKKSKIPPSPSNSAQSASSPSIPSSPALQSEPEITSEDARKLIDESAIAYPSLVSIDAAFVGRIERVEPYSTSSSHAAVVWLSESAMVASGIVSGSIVSVCLAARKSEIGDGFPLSAFRSDDWRQCGLNAADRKAKKAGQYFALAVVYPSSKVLKNEVQLSWSLSCTMGNPAHGMTTFIFPIQCCSTIGLPNGTHKGHDLNDVSFLNIRTCKDLFLEFTPSKNGLNVENRVLFPTNSRSESNFDQFENGVSSSPRTPLPYQSKLNPSIASNMPSNSCQQVISNVCPSNGTLFSTYDIGSDFGDKKSKELLEVPAAHWLHGRHLIYGNIVAIPIFGEILFFSTTGARCHGTKVHLNSSLVSEKQNMTFRSFQDKDHIILRVSCLIQWGITVKVSDKIELWYFYLELINIFFSKLFSNFGSQTVKGVLLHGPSGTGKTSLALSCVNDAGVNLFSVKGPELISPLLGESEQSLNEVFDSASQGAPAVVFIDELDAIAPARKDGSEELSQRMVATLLTLMDGIDSSDGILVIAATNSPNSIDPALRRPGRFDKEIEIGVPSPNQRLDILKILLTDMVHSLVDSQIQHLALSMHGFVGADIAALCNEAALVCLRRHIYLKKNSISSSGTVDEEPVSPFSTCVDAPSKAVKPLQFDSEDKHKTDTSFPAAQCNGDYVVSRVAEEDFLEVSFDDFEKAKMSVKPSAMREIMLEVPKVRWEDVGGQKEVKMQLVEAVEWPQKHHDVFMRYGIQPPTGVLLFGPPGCSKTLMARAVASEAGLNFFAVKGPELFSKWVGESEKAVRSLFARARENAPSVIFFDELDGFAIVRGKESEGASVGDRVMSQLLVELDGLHQRVNVTVIAATNRPDKIDSALLRPGRFDRLLYVGPPNESDREDIFQIHTRKMPCGCDVNLKELSHLTEGCTGADISLICREAALAAMEESLDVAQISMTHFKIGLSRVQPSDIHSYHEFSTKFQMLVLNGARKDDEECEPTRGLPSRSWLKSLFATVATSKASS
ncbi:hypothetical protein Sjap_009948 [Stephania japonica]|uniref:AAA+ ATPase domain-containing protein n=1 Tax=Stephania japonica TaxID=461633 RepID=A0AAP0P6P3_9MAGN